MTLSTTTNIVRYTGNGATTVFPYTFRILAATDLEVVRRVGTVETVLTYVTDYSVSGVGNATGGSVTLTTALASGATLAIRRKPLEVQTTAIQNQSTFNAKTHERVFDRQTMIAQTHREELDRSIKVPVTVTGFSAQLPPIVAGKLMKIKDDGTGLELTDPIPGATGAQGPAGNIPQYATRAARNAAIPSPTVGMYAAIANTGAVEEYTATGWVVAIDRTRVVNVRSEGATGDGVTDDTTAIRAAITKALLTPTLPWALYFPSGVYIISGELAIKGIRGLKVFGDGAYSTQLWWTGTGGTGTMMWRLEDINQCLFADLFLRFNGQCESAFALYNNGARSGITPNNNLFTNVYVDGVSGTNLDYCWNFMFMPMTAGEGTVEILTGGIATFSQSQQNLLTNGSDLDIAGTGTVSIGQGTGTVSATAGAATFSANQTGLIANGSVIRVSGVDYTVSGLAGTTATLSGSPTFGASSFTVTSGTGAGVAVFSASQAGKIQNGSKVGVAGVTYVVSAFNGTTGATLSGAPAQAGVAFTHLFEASGLGNGLVSVTGNTITFTHPQTGNAVVGATIDIDGVGVRTITGISSATLAYIDGSATTLPDRRFTYGGTGVNAYTKFVIYARDFTSGPFGAFPAGTVFQYSSYNDQNNDLATFRSCVANQYKRAGWRIGHSQSKMHRLYDCEWQGGGGDPGNAKYGILQINGSFRAFSCNGGGNRNGETRTMGADIYLTQPHDNIIVADCDFEGSCRLLETSAGSGAAFPVIFRGTRFSADKLNVDGFMVDYKWSGPLVMEGGFYGNGSNPVPRVRVWGGAFRCVGNDWDSFTSNVTDIFDLSNMNADADVVIEQNNFADASGAYGNFQTFAANDTDPILQFGQNYRTANTALTRIRELRGFGPNLRRRIYVNDNFTILQSGGNISLQTQTTWGTTAAPIPRGSFIELVYDGVAKVWRETNRHVYAGPTNILTLVTDIEAITGAGTVIGVFDARYNVDTDRTRVWSWGDARGAAFGIKTVKGTAVNGPQWSDTNTRVVFTGAAGEYLQVRTGLSGMTSGNIGLALVGVVNTTAGQRLLGVGAVGTGGDTELGIGSGDAATMVDAYSGNRTQSSADVAGGATQALYIARRAQTGGNAELFISKDNGAEAALASYADAANTIDNFVIGGESRADLPVTLGIFEARAVVLVNGTLTAAARTVLRNWSNAQHGTP